MKKRPHRRSASSENFLRKAAAEGDPARIRALLRETVPNYRPQVGAGGDEALVDLLEASALMEPDADRPVD